MTDALPYRPNVGIALFSAAGLVFSGRSHSAGPEIVLPGFEWQMPQGGIDPDEDIVSAARRELEEETGLTRAVFLAATDEWWGYDFPPYDGPQHRLTAFRGQRQRWVAFRFTGSDDEIDIGKPNGDEPPEFTEWRWGWLAEMPELVVPFKRPVYERVVAAFAGFAEVQALPISHRNTPPSRARPGIHAGRLRDGSRSQLPGVRDDLRSHESAACAVPVFAKARA